MNYDGFLSHNSKDKPAVEQMIIGDVSNMARR
jgi:hypothetical protein